MVYSVPRKAAGLMLAAAGARVLAADCGLDSWECAPSYSAVPACATAAIESAALEAGCAHGDYKCECGKKEELQGMIFDEVVANCGLLGGLDVVKAVSYLCDCDATATTFTACPTVAPSTTTSEPPIITEPPATPTDCGLDSWECAPLYSSVPACATDAIESAALEAGCAHGDYKCECSKKEELQGMIFDEVVANCGLLGGLDVVKAVSYLCDCDATATTFEPCATGVPSSTANSEPPVITNPPEDPCPSSTVSEPPVTTEPPTGCGIDSWECAPLYSAVPSCATAIIESAALEVGCAHGDYNCECSKKEELQGLIFNEVVDSCGVLGGLDVVKAVSFLCDCDATAPTFTACPTGGAPSSIISLPSSVPAQPSAEPSAEPSTTDGCDDDDEPTASSVIPVPSGQPSGEPSGEPSAQPPITTTTSSPGGQPSGNPTCGEESWACAPEFAAIPSCAVDIIAAAALEVGCPAGDHKCECSKNAEIQGLVFNDVVAACGVLGGLDVVKAVTYLCECDAAKPTFTPCDSTPGPSTSVPVPVPSGGDVTTTITTTDVVTSDCSTSTSAVVVPSGTESVPGPEPSGPCGEESWECADQFAAVPQCAVPIIEKAALDLGCAAGDHKCECANKEKIQGTIALDVLGACGAAKVADVLSSVEALCACDAAEPTFTPCGGSSGPGPTSSNPGPSGVPSGVPSSVVVSPSSAITSNPGSQPSGTVPTGPCGIDSWECVDEFKAVPACAVPIIQKAALDLGCAEGDHKCECSNAEKIQLTIALDVLGACGADKINDVLSSVDALCKCDSAKPTFTECGSNPGPTGGNGGGSGPGPTGGSSSAGPVTTTSAPVPSGGNGGGSGPSGSESSDCPAATPAPDGPCGIDSWACAAEFKAVPSCAVSIIEEAAISVGCAKGDHKCECTNQEKIQGIVFNDVLSACGIATGAQVISAVQALCECDSAKPTFTECGAAPAPTGDCNGGGSPGGGNGGGSPNPGPSSSAAGGGSGPGPTGGNGGGDGSGPGPAPSTTDAGDCPAVTGVFDLPCGEDSWECAEEFKAIPQCAVSFIEEAAISVGCAKGDHGCECKNKEDIQSLVFNDVLSACGPAKGAQVISAVEALCACDASAPTFTACSAIAQPTGGCGGGSGGGSSSFVTVTHSTTIITSAGPTGGNGGGDSGPTGGNGGGSGGGDSEPTGGSGDGDDVPVPEPSDAIPPPPITGAASKTMVNTGCVAVMAVVFAALL